MTICIDLTSLADNFSGIERYAACISRAMLFDNEVDYILLFKEQIHERFIDIARQSNITTIVIPKCNKLLFNQIRLPLTIYRIKADWYLFLAFPVPILLYKKNMISTIHDICCWDCPETMNKSMKWYFRISHRIATIKCKKIITISEYSAKRIQSKLKLPSNKICLVYCGVDERFLNYRINDSNDLIILQKYHLPDRYLLSLSTIEPRKNLRLLIDAYVDLVKQNKLSIPLVLAGRKGWKMDSLLNGIDEEQLSNIIFTGFIDDSDLPAIYGHSKAFVFPSLYEGFGIPPLEAMACGATVISSDATSLPEVLGQSAVFFESNNLKSLEEAIEETVGSAVVPPKDNILKYRWDTEGKKLLGVLKCGLD